MPHSFMWEEDSGFCCLASISTAWEWTLWLPLFLRNTSSSCSLFISPCLLNIWVVAAAGACWAPCGFHGREKKTIPWPFLAKVSSQRSLLEFNFPLKDAFSSLFQARHLSASISLKQTDKHRRGNRPPTAEPGFDLSSYRKRSLVRWTSFVVVNISGGRWIFEQAKITPAWSRWSEALMCNTKRQENASAVAFFIMWVGEINAVSWGHEHSF